MDSVGKPKDAERFFVAAREVARRAGDHALDAQVLLDGARFSQDRDSYDVALEQYASALRYFLDVNDHRRAASAVIGLGEVHQLVGDLNEADQWFDCGRAQSQEAGDRNLQLRALAMLASVASDRNDTAQTRERIQTALGALRALLQDWFETASAGDGFPLTPDGTVAIQMLAEVEAWNGNPDLAIAYAKLALALHRVASQESVDALGDVSIDLYHLGLACTQAGRLQEAERTVDEAQRVDERLHDPDDYFLLNQMGSVKEQEGQLDEALARYAQAVDILERIGRKQRAGNVQLSVREQTVAFYLDAVAVILKGQGGDAGAKITTQAFQYLERGKAQTLLELFNEANKPESERLRSLRHALSEQGPTGVKECANLEAAVAREEAAVSRASSAETSNARSPTALAGIASIADVQALLDDRTVLLEYALGERVSGDEVAALWVITRRNARVVPLSRGRRIEGLVKDYLKTLVAPLTAPDEIRSHIRLGRRLYHLLIQPAADELKGRDHIVIVPAGALYNLPFEALVVPRITGGDRWKPSLPSTPYLARHYAVNYAPSASVLVFLAGRGRSVEAGTRLPQLPVLAFGDPLYSSVPDPQAVASNVRGTYERMSHGFSRLPYSADEVQRIAALYGVAPGSDAINLRERATKRHLQAMDLTRYRILHFATHAVVGDDVRWIQPTLVLSDAGGEDPFLTMSNIFELRLDADLVVLSACKTAEGKLYRGEGLVGLTSAFLYAGSRAVMASLWQVNDQSTSLFMEAFYKHLRDGATQAEALHRARIEIMDRTIQSRALGGEQSLAAPYYWAPFVLVGAGN
jgi:CHAT domain-containing protein